MATHSMVCAGCATRFQAKSPRAKWCSSSCRTRNARAKRIAATEELEPSRLVEVLRDELTAAGAAESFDGLLAIELAQRVARSGPQGFTSMARELRVLRAAALGEEAPQGADDDQPVKPAPPDPGVAVVLAIEERREAKLADAAAGL